ncbi:trehalose-6-phosphate phophatase, biosynthetic [Stutzerimonas stutzeri DSM 10701]|uniref:trehalose-phosphatase n=1 Tax=Stutzerimonas nitrititolerans TaxID=2482751 RepID=UPI00026D7218|nr:trehalose-phosphatase [Stutzerimonas nitrititolerans]AFN79051.1 trehalose-6-phosphate phophatase, biosynthetic [Stutzerimonas stutzeri DSM 10701]
MNDQSELPALIADRCALFFDVDGTLAEIQPRPEQVFIPSDTLHALERLQAEGVPVALISGRPLTQIDQLAAPLRLPAAGVHGTERRGADGQTVRLALDDARLYAIERELATACAELPGLHLENKQVAFALHFRLAPELEASARALAEDFAARHADVLVLQPGKCVFELKPRGASKGEVIRAFMQEPPFHGRYPVFIGDDLTDEAGFEAVNALQGLSIKVGPGQTLASRRLASVAAVGHWLEGLSKRQGESIQQLD